ncbi:hypothetical protein OIU85_019030 [Salix viminalis]|uniref:Uncharacterized protein n=1 Tax=Salix viminalis TaxID=40686 RepID=A0A9Q0ZJM8_SALVM|nr:hypothetical protein OIU85_019030 [Salix viminalis]
MGIVMFLEIKIIKEQEEVFDMMEHKVKNAKVGEKRRLVFSVHGMIEKKKENGIWEKDKAEVQFLGGSAVFAARSIVKLRQLFAQQKMKDALLVIVQVGLLVAAGDK